MKFPVLAFTVICSTFSISKSKTCDAGAGFCEINDETATRGANARGDPIKVDAKECSDRHLACAAYKEGGECERNPGWMIVNW